MQPERMSDLIHAGISAMIKKYGDVQSGGMIQHLTYPANFMAEQETTISQIVSLSNDPLMKAIIMNQAVPGATEGFRRVREARPDILLLAGVPQEDPLVISSIADLVMRNDFVSAGYRIIWTAKQLGAKTFVHISFPRHMSVETLTRRRMIMEEACKDLGIKFFFEHTLGQTFTSLSLMRPPQTHALPVVPTCR
jgi:hypothetical protein